MGQTYAQVFVVLFVLLDVVISDEDCIYKICDCGYVSIDCQGLGLTSLPPISSTSNTDYSSLNLDINGITAIPAGSLLSNLTEIYLVENPTTIIDDTAFDESASTLATLSFSMAHFTRIPDAFGHLLALKSLIISKTNIDDWNEKAMNNIGKTLRSLELENAGLTSWPTWIQNFSKLTELSLDSSSISYIPDDALDKVSNSLTSLSLNNNSLTSVPKAFSNLRVLQSLYLTENQITDVTWLPREGKLFILLLDNNWISDAALLSDSLQPHGESLTDFTIKANHLTAIPNLTFLVQVGELDLSHNRISDPLSGAASPNLYSIDLSFNLLPYIPRVLSTMQMVYGLTLPSNFITQLRGTDFPPSTSWVELANNLITELNDNSFPENSTIRSMSLDNNPITHVSNLAFQQLAQLTDLSLQGTQLTRLPLAISSLTSLSLLDMTGSVNLVCTCMEKSLEGRILSVANSANVLGKCGHTGIYNFFSVLSPDCPS